MRKLLFLVSALTLTACANTNDSAATFGQSVAAMKDAQSDHAAATAEPPQGSGAQGAGAQTRYQTGNTRPLLSSSTSSVNASGND